MTRPQMTVLAASTVGVLLLLLAVLYFALPADSLPAFALFI